MLLTQEAVQHMRPGSSVVYISSYTAFNPSPPIAMYAVSKTALLGLTKALAEELGQDGIRVNCVAPGGDAGSGSTLSLGEMGVHRRGRCWLGEIPYCQAEGHMHCFVGCCWTGAALSAGWCCLRL